METLKIISDNPFRILGVYANARPADIVSNCDDMAAYISIGKSVSFDLDLNNLLPNVVRSEESVGNAKKQINLPKDKLKYALFWFIEDSCSAHALTQLKNRNFDETSEIFDMEDTFASMINKSVVAMLQMRSLVIEADRQRQWKVAISLTTELIHDDTLRDAFVKAICGEVFSIGEEELAHLYIDTLLEEIDTLELLDLFKEYGKSQEDDDYLESKAVEEPIARINAEIAKAKAVKRDDDKANLRAGKALVRNTRSDLAKVKKLLLTTDMKYQMVADELANAILQCGINYYNNTDDDDDVDKAMRLQKYACNIAVGKICKERCEKNLAILKRKKEQAAIGLDIVAVGAELESFQSKTDSISNARSLVNNCLPHLMKIKQQTGATDEFYLKMSSAVASNALGMLIAVINGAQGDSFGLKSKVDGAMSVMTLIEGLDMDLQTRNHFNKNKGTLSNMQKQIQEYMIKSLASTLSSSSYGTSTSSSTSGSENDTYGVKSFLAVMIIIVVIVLAIINN